MSLVTDDSLRKYYDDASQNIEHKTTTFWYAVLRRSFGWPFEVNPGSPLDDFLGGVDAVVEQYQESREHQVAMLWVECKDPMGSPREVESRARDAAWQCVQPSRNKTVYAMTTIGVGFRMWKLEKRDPRLISLHGADTRHDRSQYVDAGSAAASVFTDAVHEIHTTSIPVEASLVLS